ncbi:MAG: hypothetical protein VX574_01005, partial [Myxococcota bacterium]|nr:hypothetical protein [Myxococcota bacterium]
RPVPAVNLFLIEGFSDGFRIGYPGLEPDLEGASKLPVCEDVAKNTLFFYPRTAKGKTFLHKGEIVWTGRRFGLFRRKGIWFKSDI